MRHSTGALIVGLVVVTGSLGFWLTGSGSAADNKGRREGIRKLAEAIEKKDTAAIKNQTAALAKEYKEVEELMDLFRARTGNEGGLGVGPRPGLITPDGIEDKVEALARKPLPEKQLEREAPDLTRMGYQVAAVLAVAHARPPEKDDGPRKRADWLKFADATRSAAVEFAVAAGNKKPAEVQKTALALDNSCTNCHKVFKK